jgi:hypothetical protein
MKVGITVRNYTILQAITSFYTNYRQYGFHSTKEHPLQHRLACPPICSVPSNLTFNASWHSNLLLVSVDYHSCFVYTAEFIDDHRPSSDLIHFPATHFSPETSRWYLEFISSAYIIIKALALCSLWARIDSIPHSVFPVRLFTPVRKLLGSWKWD